MCSTLKVKRRVKNYLAIAITLLFTLSMAGHASAADITVTGTVNAATNLAASDVVLTTADAQYAVFTVESDEALGTMDIDHDTIIYVLDANGSVDAGTTTAIDIATGATLTFLLGQDKFRHHIALYKERDN